MPDDATLPPLLRGGPDSTEFRKLRKRILRETRAAIDQYGMVEPGARWLVCLSGGKDSYTLLAALVELQWRELLPVELLACNLDQGQPGFPATVLPEFLTAHAVPHRIEYQDTYSIVTAKVPQGRTYCALCSRLRRGNLYRIAREEGCAAVVLGHHRDDILETFFMNLFHGGRLATMPPKLLNEEGDLLVYAPAGLCRRGRLRPLRARDELSCHSLRSVRQPGRAAAHAGQGQLLDDLGGAAAPAGAEVMFRALMNARPSHLLDTALFDFSGLVRGGGPAVTGTFEENPLQFAVED
jgi:tRNA 2-thiocytidine biosynthesis protein TtcA